MFRPCAGCLPADNRPHPSAALDVPFTSIAPSVISPTTVPPKPDVTIVLGAPTGETIRPLLGMNAGPAPAGRDPNNADLTDAYHEIGVTLIRTHEFYGPLDMAMMYPDRTRGPSDLRIPAQFGH